MTTEVVEIIEDELTQKDLSSSVASFVRPRPPGPRLSSQNSRSSQTKNVLKPVTEKDETVEELSASYRSFDGIDTEALKRLSAMDDSGRSNRTGLSTLTEGGASQSSSSSSGGKKSVRPSKVKKMTEQTQTFASGSLDSSERHSMSSYDQLGSSMSLSSHAFSKSSMNSAIGFSFELGEGEDPLITPPTGPKKGVPKMSPANASTFSMPSLSEFSTAPSTTSMPSLSDFSLHDKSTHSSVMPSLGNIAEEDVSFSSASFNSFNTGTSFSTGAADNNNAGLIIGGRPMSEILKEQEKIAGRTLDVLAPTIPVKKPTTKRWTSEDTEIISNETPSSRDDAPMVARRRISDNSSYSAGFGELAEQSPGPDWIPRMVQRQDTNSTISLRLSDASAGGNFGELIEHSSTPPPDDKSRKKMAQRGDSTSSTQIRISDASACHFEELVEHSPGPDLAPKMVHRQDTDSSTRMPDLSPLGKGGGERGRRAITKTIDESGRRKAIPDLSPLRGDGAHRFSPEKIGGRRTMTKPKRIASNDNELEELFMSTTTKPKRVGSSDNGEEERPKRAMSPKIWSRSGSRSFSKTDRPPMMTRRKVSR